MGIGIVLLVLDEAVTMTIYDDENESIAHFLSTGGIEVHIEGCTDRICFEATHLDSRMFE